MEHNHAPPGRSCPGRPRQRNASRDRVSRSQSGPGSSERCSSYRLPLRYLPRIVHSSPSVARPLSSRGAYTLSSVYLFVRVRAHPSPRLSLCISTFPVFASCPISLLFTLRPRRLRCTHRLAFSLSVVDLSASVRADRHPRIRDDAQDRVVNFHFQSRISGMSSPYLAICTDGARSACRAPPAWRRRPSSPSCGSAVDHVADQVEPVEVVHARPCRTACVIVPSSL